MTTCLNCGSTNSRQYFMVKGGFECNKCQSGVDNIVIQKPHLPLFERWICTVHNCGSYNFNRLGAHEMPWCDIITEVTIGVIKPKTFGGYNGNVNRHYFRDWQEHCKKKDMEKHAISVWRKYTKYIKTKSKFKGKKHTYRKKRNKNGYQFRGMVQVTQRPYQKR